MMIIETKFQTKETKRNKTKKFYPKLFLKAGKGFMFIN